MEQNTNQQSIETPHFTQPPPASHSRKKLFFFGLLAVIGISCITAGAYLLGANNAVKTDINPTPIITSQPRPKNPTDDWQVYEIKTVSMTFKLPPSLSVYEWEENVLPGQKGNNLCFEQTKELSLLIKKAHAGGIGVCPSQNNTTPFVIGGTSTDFEAGRGGQFTDLQGFTQINDIYHARFVMDKTIALPPELITPIANNNNIQIIKIQGKNETTGEWRGPITGTPGDGYIGALIQTNNANHPGLAVQLELEKGVTEEEFDLILSTFSFSKTAVVQGEGIKGISVSGPSCPVIMNPPQDECADKPYPTTISIKTVSGKEIKRIKTQADGTFIIHVEPGIYTLTGEANSLGIKPETTITVKENSYTDATLMYDSGIR
jgi:hypothetical protein